MAKVPLRVLVVSLLATMADHSYLGAEEARPCGTTWEQEGWMYDGAPQLVQPLEHGGYQDHVNGFDSGTGITWFVWSESGVYTHQGFSGGSMYSHTWLHFWQWHEYCD